MNKERLDRQIRFLLEIDKLKQVVRRNYLVNRERNENSAEHSWHLVVMAMLLKEHAEESVDLLRVMKMVAIHDIVEIDAGDTYCYDDTAASDKAEREHKAADRIFSLLPKDLAGELRELWQAFEARDTPESRFARAIDCLMPLLHNYHSEGKSWKENGIAKNQVIARVRQIRDASPTLWKFAHAMIEDAVAKGYLQAS